MLEGGFDRGRRDRSLASYFTQILGTEGGVVIGPRGKDPKISLSMGREANAQVLRFSSPRASAPKSFGPDGTRDRQKRTDDSAEETKYRLWRPARLLQRDQADGHAACRCAGNRDLEKLVGCHLSIPAAAGWVYVG
jgi:hypothetical protein